MISERVADGLPHVPLNAKDFKDFAEHDWLNLLIRTGSWHGYGACLQGPTWWTQKTSHELGLRGAGDENRTRTISLGS
jgi:hypothetical protein